MSQASAADLSNWIANVASTIGANVSAIGQEMSTEDERSARAIAALCFQIK